MNLLFFAIEFLTIIPCGSSKRTFNEINFSWMIACFPVAGLFIGVLLVAANMALSKVFPENITNLLLIILLAFITGGLHIDGLADTADGIGSRKSKSEVLDIMKDSRIGTMGVLGVISIFLLKLYFLNVINVHSKNVVLLLMPAISRWSMLLPMSFFKYARSNGKAKIFIENINFKIVLITTIMVITLNTVFFKLQGLLMLIIVVCISLLAAKIVSNKIEGITGDVLGAVNEISEVVFLASFYIFCK